MYYGVALLDLKVDVHSKPAEMDPTESGSPSTQEPELVPTQSASDDVVIVVDDSPPDPVGATEPIPILPDQPLSLEDQSIGSVGSSFNTSTSGFPSVQTGGETASVSHHRTDPRRRFSNLSNLAQSLPSATFSTSSGFPVAGSLDLATLRNRPHTHSSYTALNQNRRFNPRARTSRTGILPANEPESNDDPRVQVRRTRSALETSSTVKVRRTAPPQTEPEMVAAGECDSQSDEEESRSPLLVRQTDGGHTHAKSIAKEGGHHRENNSDAHDAISLPQLTANNYLGETGADMDMETFVAELEDATNALILADQRKISANDRVELVETNRCLGLIADLKACETSNPPDNSKVPSRTNSWSQTPMFNRSRRSSGPYISMNHGELNLQVHHSFLIRLKKETP